jgi:hypothetical protein
MYDLSHLVPPDVLASLAGADDDALLQRRAQLDETLKFLSGSSNAWLEGRAIKDEMDRELIHRGATGKRGRRGQDEASGVSPDAAQAAA